MSRKARAAAGGLPFHVYNHGNGRLRIFNQPSDYDLFLSILAQGKTKADVKILAFCLMPTHWHLILLPLGDHDLSRFMSWISNAHVRRWHQNHRSVGGGHIYQSRYKNFPIQPDEHLHHAIMHVEANPIRASLTTKAHRWPWSSACLRGKPAEKRFLSPGPIPLPPNWKKRVNQPIDPVLLDNLRLCLRRGRPFGSPQWVAETAKQLDLVSSLRDPWRPKKSPNPNPTI